MDKEFLKLIHAACKEGRVGRAIELTKLIHQIPVFDLVAQTADFFHLPGLKEKIFTIKVEREESEDRLIQARSKRRRWLKQDPPLRQLASSSNPTRYDPLADSGPPPAIERPGMARVTVPVIERTQYSSISSTPLRSQTYDSSSWEDSIPDSPQPAEKRKRSQLDESFPSSDYTMPPPKQSRYWLPVSFLLN